MEVLLSVYNDFHQQMLTADGTAIEFYKQMGFERAGNTEPMWIYSGKEHLYVTRFVIGGSRKRTEPQKITIRTLKR